MKRTKLMSRLFSEETPVEFKEKVLEKIDEARENGSATLETEDGDLLQFADVDGDVIVEDQANENEVTRISDNPEDENDLVMSAVDIDAQAEEAEATSETVPDEKTAIEDAEAAAAAAEKENPDQDIEKEDETQEQVDATKTESATDPLPSIEINMIPGPDGEKADDIVEDLEIKIEDGINDEEKSGTGTGIFSIHFKNFSEKRARRLVRIFSELENPIQQIVEDAKVDEDVEVKINDEGEMKVMSLKVGKIPTRTFSEADENDQKAEEIAQKVNDLSAKVEEEGVTPENVEEIKAEVEAISAEIPALEEAGVDTEAIKEECKHMSELCQECETVQEAKDSEDAVKTESATPQVVECPETHKFFIEGDPDQIPYETREDAEEVAARMFSETEGEPEITMTINGLTPASVQSLLAPRGVNEDEEAPAEEEPKVDPNEDQQSRQFSVKANQQKKSVNPLLFTEIL